MWAVSYQIIFTYAHHNDQSCGIARHSQYVILTYPFVQKQSIIAIFSTSHKRSSEVLGYLNEFIEARLLYLSDAIGID